MGQDIIDKDRYKIKGIKHAADFFFFFFKYVAEKLAKPEIT